MFLKPFKIKSNTAIKGSDRKKLRSEVGRQYTSLSADELSEVIPNKEEITVMKIMTHSSYNMTVYCLQKNPIFFEIEKRIYPTVYVLWRFPNLLPSFTTWPEVFTKLVGGADLMLPGIILNRNMTPAALGNLQKADACSVTLRGNRAPVAVGQTAMSSSDMIAAAMRGKGVKILHTYRDHLWAVGDNSELPLLEILPDPTRDVGDNVDDTDGDIRQSDNEQNDPMIPNRSADIEENATEATEPGCYGQETNDVGESTEELVAGLCLEGEKREGQERDEEMEEERTSGKEETEQDRIRCRDRIDYLLWESFLSAIKSRVKKEDLPLLISKLLKVYMQPFCPQGERLDVKKSSYKKMSVFVKSMQEKGFVTMKQLTKGVDSIIDINRGCYMFKHFKVLAQDETNGEAGDVTASGQGQGYRPPQVTEMYIVTSVALPLFKACGHNTKGEAFTQQEVRQTLTNYVGENELRTTREAVTLDPLLSDVLLTKGEYVDTLPWEEMFSRCLGRMSAAYQIAFPGQRPLIKKGRVNPIKLNIVQRASNKKVTLVHNLETFGIDPEEFAHNVQVNMACSSSVSPLPGKNQGVEVLIQGNQINYISSVLIDKYHLPRKFIQGLEKAPKSGKKKR